MIEKAGCRAPFSYTPCPSTRLAPPTAEAACATRRDGVFRTGTGWSVMPHGTHGRFRRPRAAGGWTLPLSPWQAAGPFVEIALFFRDIQQPCAPCACVNALRAPRRVRRPASSAQQGSSVMDSSAITVRLQGAPIPSGCRVPRFRQAAGCQAQLRRAPPAGKAARSAGPSTVTPRRPTARVHAASRRQRAPGLLVDRLHRDT